MKSTAKFGMLGLLFLLGGLALQNSGCGNNPAAPAPATIFVNPAATSTPAYTYPFLFFFGSTGTGNGQFATQPYGIAFYNGVIFAADYGRNLVHKFDLNGYWIASYTGGGGGFNGPEGIAFTPQGRMFVSNVGTSSIQEYDQNGNF